MFSYRILFFCFSFIIASLNVRSQQLNTISYDDSTGSPSATLKVIEWMQGHWKGEAFGGITEEIWSPPSGGSMMCAFKLLVNNKVKFYEIVSISEEDNSLMLRLKHFHSDLKGWEEKNETVDFKLVKVEENRVYFDDFTFEKVSENEINIYVVIDSKGSKKEVTFNYKRVS